MSRVPGPRCFFPASLLVSLAVLVTASAAAEPAKGGASPRPVVVTVASCPDASEAAVRRIVGIELGDLLLDARAPRPANADALQIRCDAGLALVEASGAARASPVNRLLRLADFPQDAAPRALALAGIEVLAAFSTDVRQRIESRQAPAAAPPVVSATPVAAPPETPPGPTPHQRPAYALGAVGIRRAFLGAHGLSPWGGRIELSRELGEHWSAAVDGDVAGASRSVALGDTTATLASLGAAVGLRAEGRVLTGLAALGGRVGVVRFVGQPAAGGATVVGQRATRPWGGPFVAARVLLGLDRLALVVVDRAPEGLQRFALQLGAEAGFDLTKADGLSDGAPVVAISGPWWSIAAGGVARF